MTYQDKLNRVLERMGGVYHWRDIQERLDDGRMQSFAHGNSFLVTQVQTFPRARTLDWLLAVGDLADWQDIHAQAIDFADRNNISLIRAQGRRGWMPLIKDHGWRELTVNQVYQREL